MDMIEDKITLSYHGDNRGHLVSIQDLPFNIQRVYYLYGTTKGTSRGFHAHKELQQVLIAVSGHVDILLDDGVTKKTVHLNQPEKGLYVGPGMWREMHNFSKDCVLLVLASEKYTEEDYYRNYEDFLKSKGL